jgi:phosphatidylinositol-3,4,5-trisphosphate 3-phosphatase and dual-specificity protein phosphatase PTEN
VLRLWLTWTCHERQQDGGFDLDLTYITTNIIAMGMPAESINGLFRNRFQDVQNFLLQRHGTSFKVFNLCQEYSYSASKFPNGMLGSEMRARH